MSASTASSASRLPWMSAITANRWSIGAEASWVRIADAARRYSGPSACADRSVNTVRVAGSRGRGHRCDRLAVLHGVGGVHLIVVRADAAAVDAKLQHGVAVRIQL